jgi:hypothetical protein
MLQRIMQKRPETFAEKFNSFFTTQRLIMVIGVLLGALLVQILKM